MAAGRKAWNGAAEAVHLPGSRRPRVLLLADPGKCEAEELAEELAAFLGPRARVLGIQAARRLDPLDCRPDLVVVLGGDGAMLATCHRLGRRQVPVLGVNFGRVGFLASVAPERARAVLEDIFAGRGRVEPRTMLHARVRRDRHDLLDTHILNEVVVLRAWSAPLVEVDLTVDRRPVCTYRADGVIVATATGSTAYSLAAGGPILSPRLDAWVVTPIAPYMLGMRPVVLPAGRVASLRVETEAGFTADGHEELHLRPGDVVRVARSRRRFRMVVDAETPFYSRLRSKLRWGEPPGPG